MGSREEEYSSGKGLILADETYKSKLSYKDGWKERVKGKINNIIAGNKLIAEKETFRVMSFERDWVKL